MPDIDILCPTENRPEFMPWLAAQFNRLEWPHGWKRLVVVDSSLGEEGSDVLCALYDAHIKATACREVSQLIDATLLCGESLGSKRNRCLDLVEAPLFTWMDDDDWYHPERLVKLYGLLDEGHDCQLVQGVAGYLDIPSAMFTMSPRKVACWTLGIHRKEIAKTVRFQDVLSGEDNLWRQALAHSPRCQHVIQVGKPLMVIGRHTKNHMPGLGKVGPLDANALRAALADASFYQPHIDNLLDDLAGLRQRMGL